MEEQFAEVRTSPEVAVSGPASLRLGQGDPSGAPPGSVFARWRWDGTELEVSNDRYGFFPLYYWDGGNRFALSTSIPRLLSAGAPLDLDDPALSVLLRLGFLVGDDTPFRAIRALPPGARLVWRPGGVVEIRHAFPRPARLDLDRDEAIDRFVELFRQAIRRRLPGNRTCMVPLSGGCDSRHILLELLHAGHVPAACVTARYRAPRADTDADVAGRLTSELGVKHVVVDQPLSGRRTLLRHLAATNLCTLTPSHFALAVGDYLRPRAEVAYDGLAGDVLSAGLFNTRARTTLFEEGRLAELASDLLGAFNGGGGYDERTLAAALAPEMARRLARPLAVERLTCELARHTDAANPVGSFCLFNRTRRDIALMPFRLYAGIEAVHTPFLDDDVYDLLGALPARMFLDQSFHVEAVARAYPGAGSLPYARWQAASGPTARRQLRHFAREVAAGYGLGRRTRSLRPAYFLPRFARMLVEPASSSAASWFGPLILYFAQLERLCDGLGLLEME